MNLGWRPNAERSDLSLTSAVPVGYKPGHAPTQPVFYFSAEGSPLPAEGSPLPGGGSSVPAPGFDHFPWPAGQRFSQRDWHERDRQTSHPRADCDAAEETAEGLAGLPGAVRKA